MKFKIMPRSDDSSWREPWPPSGYPADWARPLPDLDASDFALRFFRIDLILSVNGVDLGISALELPALDLALMFTYAKNAVMASKVCEIEVETTLSRHRYRVSRDNDTVSLLEVIPHRLRCGRMQISEFAEFAENLLAEAIEKITESHPELASNSYLQGLLAV